MNLLNKFTETQTNNGKWINILKQVETANTDMKEMNKTLQDLQIKIEEIKKTQSEGIMEMEIQDKLTGTIDTNIVNWMKEMD